VENEGGKYRNWGIELNGWLVSLIMFVWRKKKKRGKVQIKEIRGRWVEDGMVNMDDGVCGKVSNCE
jgi:hypothetical protein